MEKRKLRHSPSWEERGAGNQPLPLAQDYARRVERLSRCAGFEAQDLARDLIAAQVPVRDGVEDALDPLVGEVRRQTLVELDAHPNPRALRRSWGALRGALEGSITDEAWRWALSALERGEAKVVVR
jgi:hypothetical protein